MPEVIEKGFLFIAQPPLYKVKKSSKERYLKNEHELAEHLLSSGLDGITIKEEEANWLGYLKACGYPAAESPADFRVPPGKITAVVCCNLMLLTRTGNSAEIRLLNYSMGDVVNISKAAAKNPNAESPKVRAQPVALIRCSLDLQRQMIIAMYGDVI